MSISPETNANLVRLEHAGNLELADTLKILLDRGEALDRTAEIIERRMDSGTYVLNEHLATLIGRTKSHSLYAKSRSQLSKDHWALLTLYKNQYPDPEIEKALCKHLYETASDDTAPLRRYIVDAMREVGSAMVLPTLEAILYEYAPTLKAKQIIAHAIESAGVSNLEGRLAIIEADSRKQFLEAIAAAITAIKQRDAGSREKI